MKIENVAVMVKGAEAATAGANDRQIDPRIVKIAQLQDEILQVLAKAKVVDAAAGTVDSHVVCECLAATMIPFAIIGEITEDMLVNRMRILYRQVETQMRTGGQAPSLIVPGRG